MAIDPTEITAIKQGCLIGSPQTVDKNKKAVPNRRSGNLHFRAVHREDIKIRQYEGTVAESPRGRTLTNIGFL